MKPSLNRRRFLSSLFTLAAGSALAVSGCAPAPTAAETPTEAASAAPEPTASAVPPNSDKQTEPTAEAAQTEPPKAAAGSPKLCVARGADAEAITRAAVKAAGGMEAYVQAGQNVVIKPNICVDYHPAEYAATTNPAVVAALVKMALEAGAKRVRVMDMPFGGTPESAYANTGIGAAVAAAGGEMEVMSPIKFVETPIPQGLAIQSWKVYKGALDADVLINVPIAKHHSLARLTLSTKNLFGLVRNPGGLHQNLGQRAADLLSLVRPALTVIDAVRILTANGPTGGSLGDVKQLDTVIASSDGIAADAYAATFFGLTGADIAYIKAGAEMGLGTMDLGAVTIEEVNV
jgi:uncharacterized protein (DUF362 family)